MTAVTTTLMTTATTTRRFGPRRASAATYWRRRAAAAALALGLVVVAGRAGSALGGSSPLAAPERRPAVVRHVVQPGESLWSVAEHLEPGADPRPLVDELAEARGSTNVLPGETIVWSR